MASPNILKQREEINKIIIRDFNNLNEVIRLKNGKTKIVPKARFKIK